MVTSTTHQRAAAGEKSSDTTSKGAGTRPSWATASALSGGHSASTSGSAGSPSSRSEPAALASAAATTPVSENTFVRLNHLDIHGDDAGSSQGAASAKKKKRGARAVGADKSGRGLRQFSMKACLLIPFETREILGLGWQSDPEIGVMAETPRSAGTEWGVRLSAPSPELTLNHFLDLWVFCVVVSFSPQE
ncbi:transcription factor-like protein DPB [Dioscorea cayenensis subsp. rotundata]|uniref:Transcription factor-like protein DPB n=1 Tax=Dioscorea cayennensis subsp. rotundata TaxID=55577 RepID=A0AB40CE92_DIOCR|nr:transcription factor-like protein DPB [Dioscorea cayenensis subsp. rotundata]